MPESRSKVPQRMLVSLAIVGLSALVLLSWVGAIGQTSQIAPADQVSPDVAVAVEQNPISKLYTYTFDIASKSMSKQDIWTITVETTGRIIGVRMPPGWRYGVFADRPLVGWSIGTEEPIKKSMLRPGQRNRFVLVSPDPPGPGWLYLEGFADVPPATEENLALIETNPALFDVTVNSVRVSMTVPQGFKPMRVGISPTRVDLARPGDVVRVIAFGDHNLPPLRKVDKYTWGLGPAGAAEIHGTVHMGDFNGDAVEDVELHFIVGALGVRRGDNTMCLLGRIDGQPAQWLRGCTSISVP